MTHPTSNPRSAVNAPRAEVKSGQDNRAHRTRHPRPWSEAFPDLDEATVRHSVTEASIRDLARALDAGAFHGDHGNDGFVCPRCGMWSAEITSPSLWYCSMCPHTGTRLGLVQIVLADAIACVALASRTVAA